MTFSTFRLPVAWVTVGAKLLELTIDVRGRGALAIHRVHAAGVQPEMRNLHIAMQQRNVTER